MAYRKRGLTGERPTVDCIGNVFWLAITELANAGVPISRGAVNYNKTAYFKTAAPIPSTLPLLVLVSSENQLVGSALKDLVRQGVPCVVK